jgi:formamidopyrimidine-DNA glycosylase
MPELPEVQTTVSSLQKVLPKLKITDVWTDLPIKITGGIKNETLKSRLFFKSFRARVTGARVLSVSRRAKNILIHLSNKETVLVHMKMTGHLLYGAYEKVHEGEKEFWQPAKKEKNDALRDPFNRFLHVVFSFSNGKQLALSDMRKFAKVTIVPTDTLFGSKHLSHLGPEPLEKSFTEKIFFERLNLWPNGKIKTALMDQSLIAGIGNIYSDEALFLAGLHPEERVKNIPKTKMGVLYRAVQKVLAQGIDFGGDSTSDYRNIDGRAGKFQHHHNVYRRKNEPCRKRGCKGVILRKVVSGRSAHFCSVHQKLLSV